MKIFLVGFMGVGKSFIGKVLAERLGLDFLDLDEIIETKMGVTITELFARLGEPGFRQLEADLLRGLDKTPSAVVATGGGAPCFHQNMDWMNGHGITVYLYAPAWLLADRLRPEKWHRPLLAGVADADLPGFIERKLHERAVFYEQCQIQFEVPTTGIEGVGQLSEYLMRFFSKK